MPKEKSSQRGSAVLLVLSMRTNIFLRTSRQLLQDLTNTKKPNPLPSNLLFDAPEENLEQMFGVKLEIYEVMEPVLCKSQVSQLQQSLLSHQVNSKTLLVILPCDPEQKENSQVIFFTSSCAPSWGVVSLSRIFQRESSICVNPATDFCNTKQNNCLIDGHR